MSAKGNYLLGKSLWLSAFVSAITAFDAIIFFNFHLYHFVKSYHLVVL